jgi:chromosome segregation ATPase
VRRLSQLESENERIKAENRVRTSERDRLEAQHAKARKQAEQLTRQTAQLGKQKEALGQQVSTLQQEKRALDQKVRDLQKEREEALDKAATAAGESDQSADLESLRKVVKRQEDMIRSQRAKLHEARKEIDGLREQPAPQDDREDTARLQTLQAEVAELHEKLERAEARARQAVDSAAGDQKADADAARRLEAANQKIERLEKERDKARAEATRLERESKKAASAPAVATSGAGDSDGAGADGAIQRDPALNEAQKSTLMLLYCKYTRKKYDG